MSCKEDFLETIRKDIERRLEQLIDERNHIIGNVERRLKEVNEWLKTFGFQEINVEQKMQELSIILIQIIAEIEILKWVLDLIPRDMKK